MRFVGCLRLFRRHFRSVVTLLGLLFCLYSSPLRAQGLDVDPGQGSLLDVTYRVSGKPSEAIKDPNKMRDLATQVQAVLYAMSQAALPDSESLSTISRLLGESSMFLQDYQDALTYFESARAFKRKSVEKMTQCLVDVALAEAYEHPGQNFSATLRTNLSATLSPLPYGDVEGVLKGNLGSYEALSAPILQGQTAFDVDGTVSSHRINLSGAEELIDAGYKYQFLLPVKDTLISSYRAEIAANAQASQKDIWVAREESLENAMNLTPVVIGIWDSGVDLSLFKDNVYTNPNADKDGYIGDEHGIAWSDDSYVTDGYLSAPAQTPAQMAESERYLSGQLDSDSDVTSPDATAYQAKLSSLVPHQVRSFLEQEESFLNYAHGTSVAGIATKGNPAARIEVCRISFENGGHPSQPSVKDEQQEVSTDSAEIQFFKSHEVRIVNMSWEATLDGILRALTSTHARGSQADNLRLAQQIFGMEYSGLSKAISAASDILFVAAAGNDDATVNNQDRLPADFTLPNLITVGAVDQSGQETTFTSAVNVDVYADGFDVPSLLPGGTVVNLSGTSMAAPQVTNLAGKMLAIDPNLTPVQIKKLIIDNCDSNFANGVTVRLINPVATLNAVRHQL